MSRVKDIAYFNRNDDVTQLALDRVDTLENESIQLGKHTTKIYQESYNRASRVTFPERRNLTDAAFEIATKEQGYS